MVTQPESSSAATSELPATSSRVLKPWVMLPTLQLPWSSATVPKVRSVAFIQNTQPAGHASGAAVGHRVGHRCVVRCDAGGHRIAERDRERRRGEVQRGAERAREASTSRWWGIWCRAWGAAYRPTPIIPVGRAAVRRSRGTT